MKNIAIFGGSFDPPHIGHETIALKVLEKLDIDKLFVVPTFLNPFKSNFHLTPQVRLELLKKLFLNNNKIDILDYEIKQKKKTPTIQTIKFLKKLYKNIKNIYLIIGSDNLKDLSKWDNFELLKSKVKFVVITRDGFEVKNDIIQFQTINFDINISSSSLRKDLNLDYIPKQIQYEVLKHMEQRINNIVKSLDFNKAENIEVFDLTDKNYIVNQVVIATALNNRHTFALLEHLKTDIKPTGEEFLRTEEDGDWIIIDLGDIIIHIMTQAHRDKYSLEEFLSNFEDSNKSDY